MSHRPLHPARAFTLVEALVVVAVIALLVGLLAPTLRSGREASRAMACAAEARELQAANLCFAHDHAERFVPGAPGVRTTNLQRWHGARALDTAPFTPEGGALTPYLGGAGSSAGVRACPVFAPVAEELAQSAQGFERGCGGYGYNNDFVGTERTPNTAGGFSFVTDAQGASVGLFKQPARTITFADCALAESGLIEYSFAVPRFWPDAPISLGQRADPSIHFRHSPGRDGAGVANIAWLDGHVTAERRTFTWSSGLYTADPAPLGIGWTGATDDNDLFDYE